MPEEIQLKGGHTTTDRRLDRVPSQDARDSLYPIRAALASTVVPVPKSWTQGPMTDQGQEGACVGHGWTSDATASPNRVHIGTKFAHASFPDEEPDAFAFNLYQTAQTLDEWPGEDYSGTSVRAGAKAMQRLGLIGEYRWAANITDVRDTIITRGPVVIGINWYESMYETQSNGLVVVDGEMVGGHCLLVYGYNPAMRIGGETSEVFRWKNSWGLEYGIKGKGIIRSDDLATLLNERGAEACVPMTRYTTPQGVAA